MDDASAVFDPFAAGAVATSPVADSFNRALERDYSTGEVATAPAANGSNTDDASSISLERV